MADPVNQIIQVDPFGPVRSGKLDVNVNVSADGRIRNNLIKNDKLFFFIDELFSGRVGTAQDMSGDREYLRRFLVGVQLKEISSYQVCKCPGLPLLGSFYIHPGGIEYDALAVAIKLSAKPLNDDDWTFWVVEVNYSTKVPEGGPVGDFAQDNPHKEPLIFKFGSEVQHEAPASDLDGLPFFNSAGMPFSPAPMFELAYPTITITRNFQDWNLQKSQEFSYALNDDFFLGYPPGLAQCLPPTAEEKYRGSLKYYRVTFVIRFRRMELERIPTTTEKTPGKIVTNPARWQTGANPFPPVDAQQIIKNLQPLAGGNNPFGSLVNQIIGDLSGEQGKIETSPISPSAIAGINNKLVAPDGMRYITWQPRILDAGLMERKENKDYDPEVEDDPLHPWRNKPTKLFDIFGQSGKPTSTPQCLNGLGRQQTEVDKFGRPIPVYLIFRYYREFDLSVIFKR